MMSSRSATVFAVSAVALELTAVAMYAAAAGTFGSLSVEPSRLLDSGPRGAFLIHWGSLVDMFGYLCLAPVVLYFRTRYRASAFTDLFAVAGLALVVIGSIGAVSMASAAPPLITDYGLANATEKAAMVPTFAALYRVVVLGMWQTLETIPAAIWLLGTALVARREGIRPLVVILAIAGCLNAAIAVYRLVAT